MAASITMASPLHHHLKLNGAKPWAGRPLLWVITPVRHIPICVPVQQERGGGVNILVADHFLGDISTRNHRTQPL